MTELPITPPAPEAPPGPGVVVLGRFQPFHRGHAMMIESAESWRSSNEDGLPLIISIGSSNRPESMRNPWSVGERREMVSAWLGDRGISAEVVAIPDIEDPPSWVSHAEKYHGGPGTLFTTDMQTAGLYQSSCWDVITGELEHRGDFEGWRVRATAQMMSTVSDKDAVRSVLSPSVPDSVIEVLLQEGLLKRLAFLGEGGEPVG